MAVNVLENTHKSNIFKKNPIDTAKAQTFLKMLDPTTSKFCFRTFDDKKGNPFLANNYNGNFEQFEEVLQSKNILGAGVFVVINQGGQTDKNICQVRYVFADTDGAPLAPLIDALKPHMVIESSPERYHVYWRVNDCPLKEFQTVQKAIAVKFHSDPAVSNLSRVMRLPGYLHQKSSPFEVNITNETKNLAAYTINDIIDGLGLKLPPHNSVDRQLPLSSVAISSIQQPHTASLQDIKSIEKMLAYLEPFKDYEQWIKVGFMLADEFGESGRDLFLRWSRGDLLMERKH